jgi:hypothetical protein
LSFTYSTMAEADADKQQLRSMLTALDAAGNQMRLDECRTWTIRGKRGYLATWGDGKRWFIYCAPGSGRKWNNLRHALSDPQGDRAEQAARHPPRGREG